MTRALYSYGSGADTITFVQPVAAVIIAVQWAVQFAPQQANDDVRLTLLAAAADFTLNTEKNGVVSEIWLHCSTVAGTNFTNFFCGPIEYPVAKGTVMRIGASESGTAAWSYRCILHFR